MSKYSWGLLRFLLIIVNNLYCIPTHFLWLLTVWPLQWFWPKAYLKLEGLGFQWLLSMVALWSYSAGYQGKSRLIIIASSTSPVATNHLSLFLLLCTHTQL